MISPPQNVPAPELLAPAGDWECARAAVENGADAIYFGVDRFNARMRATNFTVDQIPELMEFLHSRGVRGYVTFNTLLFTSELRDAEEVLRSLITAKVDAAIVQDIGLCRLIRQISPDFPIHASTQMTVTSAAGVRFAETLGCNLAVLARECSIQDIERIHQDASCSSSTAERSGIPLEVFVHGALCVAYSGQCLTSESLGGRSANRGECAQACRMPYELVKDGEIIDLGDRRYLLSPQDLAGIDLAADLARAGVASLKIEGRLKTPEYVANVTRAYRQAIDRACTPQGLASAPVSGRTRYELEMAFSRGLFTGWLRGIDNQSLVHARFGTKRGVAVGIVQRVGKSEVWIEAENPVKAGDGVVFDSGNPSQPEEGGRIYYVDPSNHLIRLRFGEGAINFSRIRPGDRVWKTSDPELERELRETFKPGQVRFRRPVRARVSGSLGSPLQFTLHDEHGLQVEVSSKVVLVEANSRPLEPDFLKEQLGRMGQTPFVLDSLEADIPPNAMIPVSELNRLRRAAVELLLERRKSIGIWQISQEPALDRLRTVPTSPTAKAFLKPRLIPLVRSLTQLKTALGLGHDQIHCELEDPKNYREAVRVFREHRSAGSPVSSPDAGIFIAPPRIFKPGEDWILRILESAEPDGFLIRNHQHLESLSKRRWIADFSFNIANPLTASYLLENFSFERLTASYDLNAAQLQDLLIASNASRFEVTLHQHMPMFHMEHCVFCAFLSKGTDYTNCGRPCEKHRVELRDRVGVKHTLKADAGCRNTLFNGRAQTGVEYLPSLIDAGLRWIRVELLNEDAAETNELLARYQSLLDGKTSPAAVWKDLKLQPQLGVTRGPLDVRP